MYDEILGFIYVNIKPFSSTNSKIFIKQTQQLLVTSQRLLFNNYYSTIYRLVSAKILLFYLFHYRTFYFNNYQINVGVKLLRTYATDF